MRAANVYAEIVGAIWLGLIWLGWGLIEGVHAQHVPGFPNSSQITYYVCIPIAVVTGLALVAIISNRLIRTPVLLNLVSTGVLIFLFPYMLPYSGGV